MKIAYEVIRKGATDAQPSECVAAGEVDYSSAAWRRSFGQRCAEWLERGLVVTTWKIA